MAHNCFISFKKEDEYYKDQILKRLGAKRLIVGLIRMISIM